jgi:hypothetical protein
LFIVYFEYLELILILGLIVFWIMISGAKYAKTQVEEEKENMGEKPQVFCTL